jgi:hypothetical protein
MTLKLWNDMKFLSCLTFLLLLTSNICAANPKYLREDIQQAHPGDFIVTIQDKTYTLLRVADRSQQTVTMEEISIPTGKINAAGFSWRNWMQQGAPQHTCWMQYKIALGNGRIIESYALSSRGWNTISLADSFLPTLLNLKFTQVPDNARRRIGSSNNVWNPPMVVDGKQMQGVMFDVWKTLWPKDGSVLSNKTIEVYLPKDSNLYPTHFPYWLQIQGGVIGNTQIRIVDSGKELISSAPPLPKMNK